MTLIENIKSVKDNIHFMEKSDRDVIFDLLNKYQLANDLVSVDDYISYPKIHESGALRWLEIAFNKRMSCFVVMYDLRPYIPNWIFNALMKLNTIQRENYKIGKHVEKMPIVRVQKELLLDELITYLTINYPTKFKK